MSSTFKHLPLLAACFLGSCMVGPDFRTPTNDLPATWEANRPPHSSDKDLRSWWNIFGDPQLNRLVSTSLNNNPDMKVALLRIREAREKLRVSQASLLPSADASAGWSLSPDRGFRSSTSQNFSLGASTSWELDLFGGNRRSIEASRASLMSTEASAGAVRTALLADVATAYFDWITACEQLRIAREQLEIQRSTLTIAEKRYKTEFAPRLDVEQATSTVSSTESRIPQLEAQVASSKNQLAVLLGTYNSRVELTLPKASVFENVRLGKPEATREEVMAALKNAQCDDILEKLPDGMDTVIGTKGVYLSGGEQQRIAIARVMLKNTPIIILDEATAFADPDNETRVQAAFSKLSQGKTVIMIAHRLSTVAGADRIYVVKDGQIAESGSSRELMERRGLFAGMWQNYQTSVQWKVQKEVQ